MERIAELVTETLALVAIHSPDQIRGEHARIEGKNAWSLSVYADDDDIPFLLGGRGINVGSISELANVSTPSGHWLNTVVKSRNGVPTYRRPGVAIPSLPELEPEIRDDFLRIIGDWHEEITDARPDIDIQSTENCDCFLVNTRDVPREALGALRRIIGWSARVRGRIGFIEWVAQ